MKAINVLRGFLSESPCAVYPDEVFGHVDAIERELEERYIEAPIDADGVPIHLYDRLKVDGGSGVYVVGNMTCCTDGWLIGTEWGQIGRPEEDAHHYEPPTVEDVLREFALKCEDAGYAGPEVERIASEFAERLQLRERDDG
jgi:hypothetical protein